MHEDLKKAHERRVAEKFLLEYRHATECALRLCRQGERPDCICRDDHTGEEIGLEIGTAYYENAPAASEWERARGKAPSDYLLTRPDSAENERAFQQGERILQEKCSKPRDHFDMSRPVWLLVYTSPWRLYFNSLLVKKRLEALLLPAGHPFARIFVMSE